MSMEEEVWANLGFQWLWVDLGFRWLIGMFDVAVCVELRKKESWGKKKKLTERREKMVMVKN